MFSVREVVDELDSINRAALRIPSLTSKRNIVFYALPAAVLETSRRITFLYVIQRLPD